METRDDEEGHLLGLHPGRSGRPGGAPAAAREAGFDGVELVVAPPGDGPLTLRSTEREVGQIRELAGRLGVELPSVMGGGAVRATPCCTPTRRCAPACVEKLGQTLERAAWLGASAVLLHPGQLRPETRYDHAWEWTREALRAVAPQAERHGVTLAIENVWNKFLLSPQEMRQLAGRGAPRIGAYFDVGNCILYGYPEQWVGILGERIKKVHVKDFKRSVATGAGFCQLLEGDADYPGGDARAAGRRRDDYLTSEVSVRNMPEGQGIADTAGRIEQIMAMA